MTRGKLRVYLGAAPGVGKTYAMLGEGHRRAERGTDVVVGFVETHGRQHTAEMLDGLEVVPRRDARLPRRHVHRDGRRRRPRPPARGRAGRRARAHQRARARATRSAGRTSRSCSPPASTSSPRSTSSTWSRSTTSSRRSPASRSGRRCPTPWSAPPTRSSSSTWPPEALRRRMAHGNVYAPEKVDAALSQLLPGRATSPRCASWPCSGRPTRSTRRCSSYRDEHDIDGHLGGPRARRRRPHRRARGRDADPPGGADRGPVRRRRPARRARHPVRRADRRQPGAPGRAATAGRDARRHLPPGASATTCREALLAFARAENATQLVLGGSRRPTLARAAQARASAPHRSASPATSTSTSSRHAQIGKGRGLPHGARQPQHAGASCRASPSPSCCRPCSPLSLVAVPRRSSTWSATCCCSCC